MVVLLLGFVVAFYLNGVPAIAVGDYKTCSYSGWQQSAELLVPVISLIILPSLHQLREYCLFLVKMHLLFSVFIWFLILESIMSDFVSPSVWIIFLKCLF